MRALAVDVGGTHVSCGAVDGRELLDVFTLEADSSGSLSSLLHPISQSLRQLRARHGENFDGIGLGFCGLVDSIAGRIASTNHKYPDATELDLVSWAKSEFGLPLILENDSRMALLGERLTGAAQQEDDVVMMTLGTGIGTAVIMCGRLMRGKHFQAGCLGGHFTIVPGGRLCSCGARGCFEAEASTYALPKLSQEWPGFESSSLARESRIDFEVLFHLADKGDTVSRELRARCIEIWKACAISLVHAYDPELLVLGGGVMQSSFPILEAIQEHVSAGAWTPWGKVKVARAQLGSNAALLGAAALLEQRR
jgi:glucokinase